MLGTALLMNAEKSSSIPHMEKALKKGFFRVFQQTRKLKLGQTKTVDLIVIYKKYIFPKSYRF